jgi:hypothetical protein
MALLLFANTSGVRGQRPRPVCERIMSSADLRCRRRDANAEKAELACPEVAH